MSQEQNIPNGQQNSNGNQEYDKKYWRMTIISTVIASIISSLFILLITLCTNFIFDFHDIKKNVLGTEDYNLTLDPSVQTAMEEYIDNNLKPDLEKYINEQLNTSTDNDNMQNSTTAIPTNIPTSTPNPNTNLDYYPILLTSAGKNLKPVITKDNEIQVNMTSLYSDDEIVAKEMNTGEELPAKKLVNKKVLMPYKEDGQEVYFYGQLNEKYHWDGECTINVYKNNKLILITDATYKDGKLKSYKQVLEDSDDSRNIWIISDREKHEEVNTGTSISYYKEIDQTKKFTLKNVENNDIITVSKFQNLLNSANAKQEGFYSGNTSNGRFNDDSGNAYLIKYNKEGYIRLFYCGKVENGDPKDDSGNAWSIVPDEETQCYVWQQGSFAGGRIVHEKKIEKKYPLTKKDIKNYLKNLNVENKYLKWDSNFFK